MEDARRVRFGLAEEYAKAFRDAYFDEQSISAQTGIFSRQSLYGIMADVRYVLGCPPKSLNIFMYKANDDKNDNLYCVKILPDMFWYRSVDDAEHELDRIKSLLDERRIEIMEKQKNDKHQ